MRYHSTRNNRSFYSFEAAITQGLAEDGGLFVPEFIPKLDQQFFEQIHLLSREEVALTMLKPFVGAAVSDERLNGIIRDALNFEIPLVKLDERIFSLELFHGPTQAFKDVGARFLARFLSEFSAEKELTVLVATSGDTGSAVAHGFHNVPGINVKILFPKGKISSYQEFQMTSLGNNIQAIEVDGSFDDCQALIKQALNTSDLSKKHSFTSANSINIARLLPQLLYYAFALQQWKTMDHQEPPVISVPSGNLGNLTAGIIAWKMGLPVKRFVAANNANDTFHQYLVSGNYSAKPSVLTYSNAMDVGNPSNFERLHHLFGGNSEDIKRVIQSTAISNEQVLEAIRMTKENHNYLLDPHGAVGYTALQQTLAGNEKGIFLETAHPDKFGEIVSLALPEIDQRTRDLSNCKKTSISTHFDAFLEVFN